MMTAEEAELKCYQHTLEMSAKHLEDISEFIKDPHTLLIKMSGTSASQMYAPISRAQCARPRIAMPPEDFYVKFAPVLPTKIAAPAEISGILVQNSLHDVNRQLGLARDATAACTFIAGIKPKRPTQQTIKLVRLMLLDLNSADIYIDLDSAGEDDAHDAGYRISNPRNAKTIKLLRMPIQHDGEEEDSYSDLRSCAGLAVRLAAYLSSPMTGFVPETLTRQQKRKLKRSGQQSRWLVPKRSEK